MDEKYFLRQEFMSFEHDSEPEAASWLLACRLAEVINKNQEGIEDYMFKEAVLGALARLTSEVMLLDDISCWDDLRVCSIDHVHTLSKLIVQRAKENSPNIFGDEITNETCE